ncbi:4-hydroxy-tetrahydrodipicolinate synthase [Nitratiruptor sp. SB155-2]|uniref:4-hydroxy-tetrahydrodipicolinate synthase n=1 Tax=Nitratiruptor sp. (strain SB155-2) TaxID=387092 RepID=DAPA_NITSB|nr:4-hydroxy-tetrahydrodipicolinate synthase [Nitratiruptor sp. SB155-2]A6Q2V4.1 RecName: Full=4-hydroxy-tetrahydrodipicolinate synthase; Short=HTPA synthase [Nitratiruptor sp. SB155-2]BAF69813.1 dihydrodipicolinate synthase [Nitratiruptor sp. SB155-2]
MEKVKGAMTALITPFRNGKLDEEAYARLIQRQIDNAIDAVVPVGTTGESATLSHAEHKRCIEIAVEVCKGTSTKVMAGAGSNATHEAIDLAQFAQKAGADAILSVSPYYNKPTQEGLYQHYKALAESVDIPVLLYNVPGRTGVDIKPETVCRLFDDVNNIYGIKEATGSIERCVELLAKRPELYVISGDDAINYPIIANGGMGVISVTANLLPDKISMLVHAGLAGQFDTAKMINDELFDINKALFCESNPIPIKAAMYIAGLIDTLEYRLPLLEPSKEHMQLIEKTLAKYEVV